MIIYSKLLLLIIITSKNIYYDYYLFFVIVTLVIKYSLTLLIINISRKIWLDFNISFFNHFLVKHLSNDSFSHLSILSFSNWQMGQWPVTWYTMPINPISNFSSHSVWSWTTIKANTPHWMVENKSWKNTMVVTAGYLYATEAWNV